MVNLFTYYACNEFKYLFQKPWYREIYSMWGPPAYLFVAIWVFNIF